MADLDTSNPADADAISAGFREVYGGMSGAASVLIAASNAPDRVKRRATAVCDGLDDNIVIQQVIDSLPTYSFPDLGNRAISGGRFGLVQLSEGFFHISDEIVVPVGSAMPLRGTGVSPWIPIDDVNDAYEGGTIVYSSDADGLIIRYPQHTDNRPASLVDLRDIEFRVLNPAVTNKTGAAVDLRGMMTGIVSNINVLADRRTNTANRIATGLDLSAGGFSSRKIMQGVNIYNFRQQGFKLNTTHLTGMNLSSGNHSNDAFSTCFNIVATDDLVLSALQGFGAAYGLSISGSSYLPLEVQGLHLESITNPVLNDSAYQAILRQVELDTGVNWAGHLADPAKCRVESVLKKGDATKRAHNRGSATILPGQTSAQVTHFLVGAPVSINLTGSSSDTAELWAEPVGATTFTINAPAAVGADRTVYWEARV